MTDSVQAAVFRSVQILSTKCLNFTHGLGARLIFCLPLIKVSLHQAARTSSVSVWVVLYDSARLTVRSDSDEQKSLLADPDVYLAYRKAVDDGFYRRYPYVINGSRMSQLVKDNTVK